MNNINLFDYHFLKEKNWIEGYFYRGYMIEVVWSNELQIFLYRFIYFNLSKYNVFDQVFLWWRGYKSKSETQKYAESFVDRAVEDELYNKD